MNLSDFGLHAAKRKTLLVLGAGASRGSSFVTDPSNVLPPLDRDFFQQLARMDETPESKMLLEFVRGEYGHEMGISMEQFFSEADYTDRFHRELNVDPGPVVKRYGKALASFMKALLVMLEKTTSDECEHHHLLAQRLHSQDCVITFNYDCLMDRALRDEANRRWDPGNGSYGFPISSGGEHWMKHSRGRPPTIPIRLLKMHGSANWVQIDDSSLMLAESTEDVWDLSYSIIPPTWFKELQVFPYAEVWKAARREVRSARVMVVVGYSVPDTDLFSRSLFKVEAGSKKKTEQLDLVVLVNPSEDARHRFIDLIRDAVLPSTRILEYDWLEELVRVIRRNVAI